MTLGNDRENVHGHHGLLEKLINSRSLSAIREGMLWTVPLIMVKSVLLLLATFAPALSLSDATAALLLATHTSLTDALAVLVAASIGYMLAILHRLPQLPAAFLCAANIVISNALLRSQPGAQASLLMFLAIMVPMAMMPVIARLYRCQWLHLVRHHVINSSVRDVLNMILPAIISTALLFIALALLLQLTLFQTIGNLPDAIAHRLDPLLLGPFIAVANSLLWFFGIGAHYALQPMLDASNAMFSTLLADPGSRQPVLHSGVLGTFVFIGGSGASLSLIIAIFLTRQSRSMRLLAMAAIPIALFNVNEILLFGLPLILNPRLFLPFVIAPTVNAILTMLAFSSGLLPAPTGPVLPWTSPILLNAYLTLDGHFSGVVLQLVLICIGTAVYVPFLVRSRKRSQEDATIHIQSMNMTFTQLQEESLLYTYDPVVKCHAEQLDQSAAIERIRELSHYDYFLEYQPQISLSSGQCVGCEALLRVKSPDGSIQTPVEMLQWLGKARQLPEVDLWVARSALHQHLQWKSAGFQIPISINVTSDTLTSSRYLPQLLSILSSAKGMISVELTEDLLEKDSAALHESFDKLHAIGAAIAIDDFGTGYSTLSRLQQFNVDAIKIDRSFLQSIHTQKGRAVMMGMLRLATTLGLKIVVEGVENKQQLIALQAADVDDIIVQGWYYSKALSAPELMSYVRGLLIPHVA